MSSLDSRRKADKVPVLEATDAQLKAFESSNTVQVPAPPPVPPANTYPPLEVAPGATR